MRKLDLIVLAMVTIYLLASPLALGQGGNPPASTNESSAIRTRLIGTWELVSTEERLKDGTTRPYPDMGPDGKGYLMYTTDGHMCAALMNPHRAQWKDMDKPSEVEKVNAMDGFVGYCGRYEIDEANHIVYHFPEVAWMPNYVGTKQKRPYRFDADRLTFSDRDTSGGEVESWTIRWKKMR